MGKLSSHVSLSVQPAAITEMTAGSWDCGSVSLWQRASHELRVSSSQSNMR
jgi:hypothetical protein